VLATVDQDVTKRVSAMQKSIDESNEFIVELRGKPN
jgi:hypothetical protein